MQVQYVHLRNKAQDGSISCKGGRTLAVMETPAGVVVGEARCSSDDNYCKATGRAISLARLQEKLVNKDARSFVQEVHSRWSGKRSK